MTEKVTVDFFTIDPSTREFVMYLVEGGPWDEASLTERLTWIQDRIYKAVDVAIDGHLAREHPESLGNSVRIQVDLHGGPPEAVQQLVGRLDDYVRTNHEYQQDIARSPHINGLRILARLA
jgi:hypothetical protein